MTCIICQTRFYHQTFDSPAEPCDCGANFTKADWREEGGDERKARLTKRWEWMETSPDAPFPYPEEE